MKKCIIILSGGLDSSTLAYYLKNQGYELEAISFNYGQKHLRELDCAKKIAEHLNIPHQIVDMSFLGKSLNSALTQDRDIPEGAYDGENMRDTVVPNRNSIMALIAHAIGYSKGIKDIALGVHAGDHFIYPDCRPNFIVSLEVLLQNSNDDRDIRVHTPFVNMTKGEIVKIGLELEVPYQNTHTCYKGLFPACGRCGSCDERLGAFSENNSIDPLDYVSK